ncbi:FecR domain-containing protein [Mucilaginibacter sp.]|uniref:FecR family protein n=1 Tax=Mucilaginibacter sp. TaxID=1882438 RepID=UPI00284A6620|nr:FecR domain-containing protein [Mucilaginibacter sp.]MDR3694220.1 FecR domain-containing protein [Mucilaginibacter sp.]
MAAQDRKRLIELGYKWLEKKISPEEKQEFETWLDQVADEPLEISSSARSDEEYEAMLFAKIEKQTGNVRPIRRLWTRIAAAASILIFLSVGGYFLLHKQSPLQTAQNQIHNDVAPGSNKAILTLSNGKQISLTDAQKGVLSEEGNELIKKTSDGAVSYEGNGSAGKNQQLTYNTVATPRGGQWSVVLPDGTKAMLDAASSIKYPVDFIGNERKVEVTGQVYFEVIHDAAKPFRVITKGQVIEDIGTKFNIDAYDDEQAIKTTLVEGAVRVSNPGAQTPVETAGIILKPGQQTLLQNNKLTVSDVNTEEVIAWRNGYFSLNDENIGSIMRKLSRWYDIQVEFKGDIPNIILGGEISRSTTLSQALKILEVANVHFIVEGKKVTVTP